MAWSNLAKLRARERFWKPVLEQANILLEMHDCTADSFDDIYYNTSDYIDSSIFGNRWNSPVFRNALRKILRESSSYFKSLAA